MKPLAAGAEGAIYLLGDGTVAKVWGRRREPELMGMQKFYADLARAGLPFATPVILRVEELEGVAVTFERELPGEPLQKRLAFEDHELDPAAVGCVVEVIRSLAGVPDTDSMRQRAVLDENRPFWAGADDFPTALMALLERRVACFGDLLRAQVPDFNRRYARILEKLAALDRISTTVIHGDLYGENILVDKALRPLAVLDSDSCPPAAIRGSTPASPQPSWTCTGGMLPRSPIRSPTGSPPSWDTRSRCC